MRKALGLKAASMAQDLDVSPSMVFQLERSEWKETITLKRLKEVAWAMECELVYCVVLQVGNFEDQLMVWAEQLAREKMRRKRRR